MKITKLILILLLSISIIFALAACGGNNEPGGPSTPEEPGGPSTPEEPGGPSTP